MEEGEVNLKSSRKVAKHQTLDEIEVGVLSIGPRKPNQEQIVKPMIDGQSTSAMT